MKRTIPQTLRRYAPLLRRDTAGARRAVFRLVTPAVDRHGTVILPDGVDLTAHKLAGSPFLWMHESGDLGRAAPPPDVVIGKVAEYAQSAAALDITVEFDTDNGGLADKCWAKVQAGLIRMVSIGAAPLKIETRRINGADVTVFARTELLEASLVIVGSNREALRLDRAAAMRALDTMNMETPKMDKNAICKLLGIDESADREIAEAALTKYLCETSDAPDARKAAAAALDECFPESPEGEAAPPAERAAEEGDKDDEIEAMRAANVELSRALADARAAQAAAPKAEQVAADTVKREAKIAADVDAWIAEGRVQRAARDEYLTKHRQGKAMAIVRHIPAGTWTTGQRLSGGNVGTPIADLPAQPETATKRDAKALVAQARSMDRSGYVVSAAPAAQDSATKSEARKLMDQARGLRG